MGFDLVHLGEHHGSGYQLSAPPVVLAAIGERTDTVRLSTGVTLAANLDPVRMAEDYATVDVLSGGRAEIVAGRGSYFARTFEYLGQDPTQSKALFAEHVALLSTAAGRGAPSPIRPACATRSTASRPVHGRWGPSRCGSVEARAGKRCCWRRASVCPLMLPSVFGAARGLRAHGRALPGGVGGCRPRRPGPGGRGVPLPRRAEQPTGQGRLRALLPPVLVVGAGAGHGLHAPRHPPCVRL